MGFGSQIATVLESVGANARRWRIRRGLTQAKLAEITEMDLSFIQRVEAGRQNLSVGAIVRVTSALEIRPSVLFRPAKPAKRPTGRPRQKKRRPPR